MTTQFSRAGKPTDNAFIESFNGSLRDECLNVQWFDELTGVKTKLQAWQREYNEEHSHSLLGYGTPAEYATRAG